jgi:hypothetical protein
MAGWKAVNWRLWLFRGLVAITAIAMIISFSKFWWTANDTFPMEGQLHRENIIRIYGWGLRATLEHLDNFMSHNTFPSTWLAGDITPIWQSVLAWVYVEVTAVLAISSTWLKGKKGSLLLAVLGIIYITYCAATAVVISNRAIYFNLPLQGRGIVNTTVELISSLRFGYYLALSAGMAFILLALLRGLILGRHKATELGTKSSG